MMIDHLTPRRIHVDIERCLKNRHAVDGSFSDGLQGTVPLPSRMVEKNMEKKHHFSIFLWVVATQIFLEFSPRNLGKMDPI